MLLNANSRGDKIFQRGTIYQKILFWGSKNFNKIEINYPGGLNISIYLDRGELKMGVHFSVTGPYYSLLCIPSFLAYIYLLCFKLLTHACRGDGGSQTSELILNCLLLVA